VPPSPLYIKIDGLHFLTIIKLNFPADVKIVLLSTIQFVATLQAVATELRQEGYEIIVP
jgi:2-(3-amino-3-carboxypropyl)histidine synthase